MTELILVDEMTKEFIVAVINQADTSVVSSFAWHMHIAYGDWIIQLELSYNLTSKKVKKSNMDKFSYKTRFLHYNFKKYVKQDNNWKHIYTQLNTDKKIKTTYKGTSILYSVECPKCH